MFYGSFEFSSAFDYAVHATKETVESSFFGGGDGRKDGSCLWIPFDNRLGSKDTGFDHEWTKLCFDALSSVLDFDSGCMHIDDSRIQR